MVVIGKLHLIRLIPDIELTIRYDEGKSDLFRINISVQQKNSLSANKVTFYLSNALNDQT